MKKHPESMRDMKTAARILPPVLIAHRGAMAEAPENTQAAFDIALLRKADGIEFDVRLTADNVPVIFHDDDLLRITGRTGRVSDLNYKTLQVYDYGGSFAEAYAGAGLMRLEEALHLYSGRAILMIELKTGVESDNNFLKRRRLLAETVTQMIAATVPAARYEYIHVLSFDCEALSIAHAAAPGLKYMLNLDPIPSKEFLSKEVKPSIYYGFGMHFDEMEKLLVKRCHDAGKTIMTYSCNTKWQVAKALDDGADYVLTDDPAAVQSHFSKLARRFRHV